MDLAYKNYIEIPTPILDNIERNSFINRHESVLDFGCKYGVELFDAFHSIFEKIHKAPYKLVGVDIDSYGKSLYENYHIYCNAMSTKGIKSIFQNEIDFNTRFSFREMDMKNFHFNDETYGLIIARNSLHFMPANERLEMIEKMYNGLNRWGLFYSRLFIGGNEDGQKRYPFEMKEIDQWKSIFKNEPLHSMLENNNGEICYDLVFRKN